MYVLWHSAVCYKCIFRWIALWHVYISYWYEMMLESEVEFNM